MSNDYHDYDMYGHEPGCSKCASDRRALEERRYQDYLKMMQKRATKQYEILGADEIKRLREFHRPLGGNHRNCGLCVFDMFDRLLATAEALYAERA